MKSNRNLLVINHQVYELFETTVDNFVVKSEVEKLMTKKGAIVEVEIHATLNIFGKKYAYAIRNLATVDPADPVDVTSNE